MSATVGFRSVNGGGRGGAWAYYSNNERDGTRWNARRGYIQSYVGFRYCEWCDKRGQI